MSRRHSRRNIEVSRGRDQNFLACAEISAHHQKIDFSYPKCLSDWLLKLQEAVNRILAHAEISAHHRKIDFSCFFSVYLDKMIPEIGFAAFWDFNIFYSFSCPRGYPDWLLKSQEAANRNFWRMQKFLHIIEKSIFHVFLAYIWIKWSLRYAWWLSETAIFLLLVFHIPKAFQTDYWSFRRPPTEFWCMQKVLYIIEKSSFPVFCSVYLDKMIPEIRFAAF